MLSHDLDRYIVLQRACGLKFTTQPSLLRSFVACAEAAGDTYVRADRVLDWAARTTSATQARNRLAIVRRFAMALAIEDPGHEVPSADAFGRWRFERRMPHIYTAEEIAALMAAARRLGRPGSIRPETMVTLIGLLAATGLRVSEALKLDVEDITADGLVIRETKFRKSRLVPLHSSARAALDRYLRRRRKVPGKGTSFFVGDSGRRPAYVTLYALFLRLGRETGLRGLPGEKGPRLHDLRHTFAVRSLESCGGDRRAISRHMLALATYMGHSDPSHTWWYIQATPTLMHQIYARAAAWIAGADRWTDAKWRDLEEQLAVIDMSDGEAEPSRRWRGVSPPNAGLINRLAPAPQTKQHLEETGSRNSSPWSGPTAGAD